jgi:hypothetical protein
MRFNAHLKVLLFLLVVAAFAGLVACNKPIQDQESPAEDVPGDELVPMEEPETEISPAGSETELYDAVDFLEHMTILTGTVVGRGQVFTKTWAVENTGTTTWTNDYTLVFDQGEQMDGPDEQPLLHYYHPLIEDVKPGDLISITVVLTSSLEEGEFIGYWLLRDLEGEQFGFGPESKDPMQVDIIVKAGAGTEVNQVHSTSLDVSPENYSGPCPVQLIFSGAVEVEGMGPFEYEYVHDVNTDLPGWEYLIPAPNQFSYDSPAWHVVDTSFVINIPEDTDGWMRLESVGPGSSSFSEVYYNVDCD